MHLYPPYEDVVIMSLDLPELPTLHTKPSWLNRAGRVDRSACVELRASEIKRLLGGGVLGETREKPGLEGSATSTIRAEFLEKLHASRQPRSLAGDHRTEIGRAHV